MEQSHLRQVLTDALSGTHARDTLFDAIEDFPEDLMNTKPPHVPYSFWQLLEHIRITHWDLLHYMTDPEHVSPNWPEGYWPKESDKATPQKWEECITSFKKDREALQQIIADTKTDLFAPLSHMQGSTIFEKMMLVINHTAYHVGEFIMARQTQGYWESTLTDQLRK